jgi:hypothetical protein
MARGHQREHDQGHRAADRGDGGEREADRQGDISLASGAPPPARFLLEGRAGGVPGPSWELLPRRVRVPIREQWREASQLRAGKKPVHVTPHEEGWAVRRKRASRARRTHRTQADAERAGRGTARRDQTEFVLHGRDGRIPDRDGYGNDPHPPHG